MKQRDVLLKFSRTPGLCSQDELQAVQLFLTAFGEQLDHYRSVFGEPLGQSVQSYLDKVDFYLSRS